MSMHGSSTERRYTPSSVLTVFNVKVATFRTQMDLCRYGALLKMLISMIVKLSWNYSKQKQQRKH